MKVCRKIVLFYFIKLLNGEVSCFSDRNLRRILQEFHNHITVLFHPKGKNSDDSLYADKYELYLPSETDGSRILRIPIEIPVSETANFAYRSRKR